MTIPSNWYAGMGAHNSAAVKDPFSFEGITQEKFDNIVSKAAVSNGERRAEAIRKADSYSFGVANPWFLQTKSNIKLVNHWLDQKGIKWPTFPDFAAAVEELSDAGVLDIDEAELAKDQKIPRTFKGALTGRVHDSVDSLIANEREAAISHVKITPEDSAFDDLPIEEVQAMLKEAERIAQSKAQAPETRAEADAWLTLHPEWRHDTPNGKMMLTQLRLNGVINRVVTVEDYEIAARQIIDAGLVRLNPAQVKKLQAKDIVDRAERAVNTPGSVFDKTSEEEMYNLPLDEIRRL